MRMGMLQGRVYIDEEVKENVRRIDFASMVVITGEKLPEVRAGRDQNRRVMLE